MPIKTNILDSLPVSSYGKNSKIKAKKKKRKKNCNKFKEMKRAKCLISKYKGKNIGSAGPNIL